MTATPRISAQRNMARLHYTVGGPRWSSSFRAAPLLTAAPTRALIDEQISIKGRFLAPHCPVTVCAQMHSEDGDLWESCAYYNTKADGTINLARDSSVGGSYLGCEPMGLFWSLQPAPDAREGPGPFPAILDLWGFGGGLLEYRSALFASRGYASLSLAYSGHTELPGRQDCVNVGDSYFKSAFQLLQDHLQICADKVAIIGLSFGAYLTLRIAAQTDVKPSCLICINGVAGSLMKLTNADGRTVEFDSHRRYWRYDDEGHVSFRDASSPGNLPPEGKVKVEDLSCPLMCIVGEDDLAVSSPENANLIEETLKAAGKSHLFTRLSYPGAGHFIEPPYAPNSRASLWKTKPNKLITLWGGNLAPHAAAQEDAWKKILDFIDANLRC
ncbi:uncharacterized protein V6R79_023449 [Siganus canaliculatus]